MLLFTFHLRFVRISIVFALFFVSFVILARFTAQFHSLYQMSTEPSEKIQDGFYDLVTNNCIELAMESIILEPEFSCLFTEVEVNEAKRRLGRR